MPVEKIISTPSSLRPASQPTDQPTNQQAHWGQSEPRGGLRANTSPAAASTRNPRARRPTHTHGEAAFAVQHMHRESGRPPEDDPGLYETARDTK
jgi:hypothetical protein